MSDEINRSFPPHGRRAHLDDLGPDYEPSDTWGEEQSEKTAQRQRRWAVQQRRYGFDDRQTWSLDTVMIELLYERLKAYFPLADDFVDLTFHKFEFEDETLTQRDAVLKLIELAHQSLDPEDGYADAGATARSRLWNLWAIVHPHMWW